MCLCAPPPRLRLDTRETPSHSLLRPLSLSGCVSVDFLGQSKRSNFQAGMARLGKLCFSLSLLFVFFQWRYFSSFRTAQTTATCCYFSLEGVQCSNFTCIFYGKSHTCLLQNLHLRQEFTTWNVKIPTIPPSMIISVKGVFIQIFFFLCNHSVLFLPLSCPSLPSFCSFPSFFLSPPFCSFPFLLSSPRGIKF